IFRLMFFDFPTPGTLLEDSALCIGNHTCDSAHRYPLLSGNCMDGTSMYAIDVIICLKAVKCAYVGFKLKIMKVLSHKIKKYKFYNKPLDKQFIFLYNDNMPR
ncbi:MAG: hypothetical protein K2I93_08490, partial [Oscillospiraceae bacterium]|nr:hypothetical protein [Oscillospiraceae bacterium]